jgi:hypothetical protein
LGFFDNYRCFSFDRDPFSALGPAAGGAGVAVFMDGSHSAFLVPEFMVDNLRFVFFTGSIFHFDFNFFLSTQWRRKLNIEPIHKCDQLFGAEAVDEQIMLQCDPEWLSHVASNADSETVANNFCGNWSCRLGDFKECLRPCQPTKSSVYKVLAEIFSKGTVKFWMTEVLWR